MSGLYKFFPTPSDKMGILWALSAVRDACIVEYGPGGTTHYSMEGVFKINGEIKANTYTTHIDEDDVVMGDTAKIRKTLLEVDEVYQPKYIFVVASSLVSVIGTDITGIVYEMQDQIRAKLIVYQSGGFKGDYTDGVKRVLCDLAKYVVQPSQQKKLKSYNLIGCCIDDYRYYANIEIIKKTLFDALGLQCGCVFTAGTSVAEIEEASSAALNIVLRQEGIDCAALLKERFGTEYIYAHPLGYNATMDMIEKTAEALGLQPDEQYIAERKKQIRQNLMHLKGHFRKAGDKTAVISGGYDHVQAMEKFLCEEIGFTVSSVLVNHKKAADTAPAHYIFNAGEDMKEAELIRHRPGFVFGDAVLLHYADGDCFRLQTQNPNLNQILITKHKPHLCFDGADDIAEKLLNGHAPDAYSQ